MTSSLISCATLQAEDDGVSLANACKYGLGAGIWTQDLSRAHRVSEKIEAGLVWVNTHHRNDPSSPWYAHAHDPLRDSTDIGPNATGAG